MGVRAVAAARRSVALVWWISMMGCVEDPEVSVDDDHGQAAQGGGGADASTPMMSGGAGGEGPVALEDAGPEVDAISPPGEMSEDAGFESPADAGEPTPEAPACDAACELATECTLERCEGYGAAEASALRALCMETCEAQRGFRYSVGPQMACGEVVRYMAEALERPTYEEACCGLITPRLAECGRYGAKAASCLVGMCEPAEEIENGLKVMLTSVCNQMLDVQSLAPDDFEGAARSEGCGHPLLGEFVSQFVVDDPERGQEAIFGPICEEGLRRTPGRCEAACGRRLPCEPGTISQEDAEGCYAACRARDTDVYDCVAELVGDYTCGDVLGCVSQPPQD